MNDRKTHAGMKRQDYTPYCAFVTGQGTMQYIYPGPTKQQGLKQ